MFAYKVIQIAATPFAAIAIFFTLAKLSDLSSLSAEEMSNEIGTRAKLEFFLLTSLNG